MLEEEEAADALSLCLLSVTRSSEDCVGSGGQLLPVSIRRTSKHFDVARRNILDTRSLRNVRMPDIIRSSLVSPVDCGLSAWEARCEQKKLPITSVSSQ